MPNFVVSVSYEDEDGHIGSTSWNIIQPDIATLVGVLETSIEAFDVLTDGRLVNLSVALDVDTSGWTLSGAASAGSDVEIGGRFILRSAAGFLTKLTIPAFIKDTYTVLGGIIDPGIAAVSSFILSLTGGNMATSHWEDVVAYEDGYEVFNGKR